MRSEKSSWFFSSRIVSNLNKESKLKNEGRRRATVIASTAAACPAGEDGGRLRT